jgi:octaprenyl-diphosphate synthase
MMDIEDIQKLTQNEMQAMNQLIQTELHSEVVLVNQIGHYIVNSGGKRLRPLLSILTAKALNYQGNQHINLAAVIEFIHTATLLHDDVVDASNLRRGKQTANDLWGNEASVLVGDFLYSRAFQMMVNSQNMRVMAILANATNVIAEGEVLQLLNCHNPKTTEQQYLAVIRYKTAKLFEAAVSVGVVISQADDAMEQRMAAFGMHLGTAFQLVDDVLDYSANSQELGKNVGDDLAEGKPTLPLIYALKHSSKAQQQILISAIEHGGKDQIKTVIDIINQTDAITYTAQAARAESQHALQALTPLPDSVYKQALMGLAEFAIARSH